MRKRGRIYVRVPVGDVALLRAAADRQDMTVSQLVRTASVAAALQILGPKLEPSVLPTAATKGDPT